MYCIEQSCIEKNCIESQNFQGTDFIEFSIFQIFQIHQNSTQNYRNSNRNPSSTKIQTFDDLYFRRFEISVIKIGIAVSIPSKLNLLN